MGTSGLGARFIAGDVKLGARFRELRQQVLAQKRDPAVLAQEVVDMRDKMRAHLLSGDQADEKHFHLKQGLGGIVDIEFLVQFAVLAWAGEHPQLTDWSDVVRILETLQKTELLPAATTAALSEAYISYRSASHQLALQQLSGVVAAEPYVAQRAMVVEQWRTVVSDNLPQI